MGVRLVVGAVLSYIELRRCGGCAKFSPRKDVLTADFDVG
jgi:hypothetical protein